MENNKLLPVGSVVLLKKATHRLMIIGYTPLRTEGELKLYDYWGCFYPEGYLQPDQTFVFNREQIDKVINVGFSDDEEKKFRGNIENIIKKVKDENGKLKYNAQELSKFVAEELLKGLKGGK